MANTDASAILQRLLDDDYVHEQLSEASAGVRDIYRRVRQMPPYQVIEDKTVYDRGRESAAALTAAGRRLAGTPPPPPAVGPRRCPPPGGDPPAGRRPSRGAAGPRRPSSSCWSRARSSTGRSS